MQIGEILWEEQISPDDTVGIQFRYSSTHDLESRPEKCFN